MSFERISWDVFGRKHKRRDPTHGQQKHNGGRDVSKFPGACVVGHARALTGLCCAETERGNHQPKHWLTIGRTPTNGQQLLRAYGIVFARAQPC